MNTSDDGISGNLEFQDGVAVVTKPNAGAMAEASVGGQRSSFEPAD